MRFRVWAPFAESSVTLRARRRAARHGAGRAAAGGRPSGTPLPGARYAFSVDDGEPRADPRALSLPDGPEGPAQVIDREQLSAATVAWDGVELPGAVIYELHVGTFTPEGTLDAAIERLDHLVELGVGIVEVMPLASFPGRHGWGYDGVGLYAVHEPYGGPFAFRRFVDACHARGLGVCLDVVYNHLGPSGNHLGEFGPYFTDRYATPWGDAVNLDDAGSDEVRRFILDNALHVAARLPRRRAAPRRRARALRRSRDHAARGARERGRGALGRGRPAAVADRRDRPQRPAHRHRPRAPAASGWTRNGPTTSTTRCTSLLTGETQGYYADFAAPGALAKVLEGVFFHDGRWSSFRQRSHGRPLDRAAMPGFRFVVSLQTHDQVGNRALGDRLSAGLSPGLLACGAALAADGRGHPDALHGRGMGRLDAVDVLHRSHRPVHRRRRPERPAPGVRRARLEPPRRARSPGAPRRSSARGWTGRSGSGSRTRVCSRGTATSSRLRRERADLRDPRLDEVRVDPRRARPGPSSSSRGEHLVVVNLAPEPRTVPLSSGRQRRHPARLGSGDRADHPRGRHAGRGVCDRARTGMTFQPS